MAGLGTVTIFGALYPIDAFGPAVSLSRRDTILVSVALTTDDTLATLEVFKISGAIDV